VPSERRPWTALGSLVALAGLAACPSEKQEAAPSRFEAATARPAASSARFCDRTWPATGEGARRFEAPPLRPLEGAPGRPAAKGWRWVNAWATWCGPCVDEMALLGRWRQGLERDGLAVSFELLSIDGPEAEPALRDWLPRLPGSLTWIRAPEEVPPWLERTLGLEADSAIPIHVLVDPRGQLRCARVGAVHPQDYGAVRALLGAGG
jgi:hypothetical protein